MPERQVQRIGKKHANHPGNCENNQSHGQPPCQYYRLGKEKVTGCIPIGLFTVRLQTGISFYRIRKP
jgi:hypothetical protein